MCVCVSCIHYINQSINQYLSASCHTALGHKLALYTNSPHIHKKTVDLDNVSFTYIVYNSVYNSVKGSQGIGSSVRHYVPKRAFHIVWITTARCLVVVASQARDSCRGIFIRIGGMIMILFQ